MTEEAKTEVVETAGGLVVSDDPVMPTKIVELNLPALPPNPTTFDLIPHVATLARMLAHTEFAPALYRNRPAALAGAYLMGHEIGLPPMQSALRIHITEPGQSGKSVILMEAQAMRALVLSKGHRLWFPEVSSHRVIVHGQRRGEEDVQKVIWTMDDAKKAGPRGFSDPKSAWQRYPRQMLTARATAELCRLMFADVLGGISYIPEEIEDGVLDAPLVDEPKEPEKKQTRSRSAVKSDTPSQETGEAGGDATKQATSPNPGKALGDAMPSALAPNDGWLPVPGDEVAAAVDRAPEVVPADPPPGPEPIGAKTVQKVVLAAKEAKVNRADLCWIVSDGRTSSSKELTIEEVGIALAMCEGVARGEIELRPGVGGSNPHFEDMDKIRITDRCLEQLQLLSKLSRDDFVYICQPRGWKVGTPVSIWVQELELDALLGLNKAVHESIPRVRAEQEAKKAEGKK